MIMIASIWLTLGGGTLKLYYICCLDNVIYISISTSFHDKLSHSKFRQKSLHLGPTDTVQLIQIWTLQMWHLTLFSSRLESRSSRSLTNHDLALTNNFLDTYSSLGDHLPVILTLLDRINM